MEIWEYKKKIKDDQNELTMFGSLMWTYSRIKVQQKNCHIEIQPIVVIMGEE